MEEAFIARLLAHSGLTGLVSTRIYWLKRPQTGLLPSVTLQRITGDRDYHFAGASGLVETRIQADCWGEPARVGEAAVGVFSKVLAVKRQLLLAVHGIRGTYSGVRFDAVFIDSERQSIEGEDPSQFHRISLDLLVWHSEA